MTTFRQRLRYRFDSFMSKGGSSIFWSLFILFMILLVLIITARAVVFLFFGEEGSQFGPFLTQIYIIFLELTDPGNMAQDISSNPVYKITAIMAGMAGVIIVSMLIAFITTSLDQKLTDLKKGHSKVIEDDHTLVLGWNDRVVEIVRELLIANESESDACVVILSQQEKELMDDDLKMSVPRRKTTRLVTRSGAVSSLVNLDVASVTTCKSVIVLATCTDAASQADKDASDSRVIKAILGVIVSKPEGKEMSVVAELFDERNRQIAEEIAPGEIITIDANDLLARIIVQTSRSTGLSVVYGEILSFDGCEMYFHNASWNNGLTFGELQFHFPDGVPMGIRRDGEVLINPAIDTVMQAADDVLILAEDDSTIEFQSKAVAQARDLPLAGNRLEKTVENELIIGWNAKAPLVVREYNDYVMPGSTIRVVVREPSDEIMEEIERLQQSLSNVTVTLTRLDPLKTEALERIEPWTYNNIIILSQGTENTDPETVDSQSIVILLLLRKIFAKHSREIEGTKLISEVMDSSNQDLLSRAGVNDFIISNRFISMLMAQVSEEPDIKTVYDQLFSEDGSEIYLKSASLYFDNFPVEATFADLMRIAQKRQEICIGVKLKADERDSKKNYGVKLIPDKNKRYVLNEKDCLVVVSEDET